MNTIPISLIDVAQDHVLRQVHVRQACVVAVTQGYKDIWWMETWQRYEPGQLLLLGANTHWHVHNHPGGQGHYRAQVLEIPPFVLTAFAQQYPQLNTTPIVNGLATVPLRAWLEQAWAHVMVAHKQNAWQVLLEHRVLELLLVLAQAGWRWPVATDISLSSQIHRLVQQNLEEDWGLALLAQHFHTSESTLQRRLQLEGTSAARCIRDARLERALALLQTTRQPIGQIALACGYNSHSRFSHAFESRFGSLPLKFRKQGFTACESEGDHAIPSMV